ncbi:MAG TPA: YIP1 family protein [Lachnospiraceae bacterium]|nr:YIP1 family protein [Lachnospiraceae bacterium]
MKKNAFNSLRMGAFMSKKIRTIIVSFVILLLTGVIQNAATTMADTPYKTYTQDGYGWLVETQTAYTPLSTITKIGEDALANASDMYITNDNQIYIADTGNKRIVVADVNGNFVKAIGEGTLKEPTGVYVTEDKSVYVADKGARKVFVFNGNGQAVAEYGKPDHPLYGDDMDFKPDKLVVDHAGNMYIICEGNTNGMVHITPTEGGTFLGYFGTNFTSVSFTDVLRRLILSDEQRAKLASNIPSTPNNLAIDEKGLIYTVTKGETYTSLKKLNIAGKNIIEPTEYDTLPAAVTIGNYENIFVLSDLGYVYEYSKEGNLLFLFGGADDGRQRIGLFKKAVDIEVDSNNNLYVLDQEKNEIQVFKTTEFTDLLHESLYLYQNGKYTQSKEPLKQVIEMNSLFDYANLAMGQAYLQEENYGQALKFFKMAKDPKGYSDSFWEVRNIWLKDNLVILLLLVVVLMVIKRLFKYAHRKYQVLAPIVRIRDKIGSFVFIKQVNYSGYFMKHPIDGCYGVRRENKASYKCANFLLVLFMVLYMLNKYATGFILKTVREGEFDIFGDILFIIAAFLLTTICTYLVCTITDGEGTFKQIYCAFVYALAPYIVMKPFIVLVSNGITYNEVFLINFANLVMYIWVIILIFMAIKEVNNYSVKETFRTIGLTLFTALIAILLLFIIYILVSQVIDFVQAIYGEVVYRIENA